MALTFSNNSKPGTNVTEPNRYLDEVSRGVFSDDSKKKAEASLSHIPPAVKIVPTPAFEQHMRDFEEVVKNVNLAPSSTMQMKSEDKKGPSI